MIRLAYPFKKNILACGPQQQANFCLTKKNYGFVVNDLGDLSDDTALQRYEREIERVRTELKIKPKIISHELDREYSSTRYAQRLNRQSGELKLFPVQHHRAHLASCLGENGSVKKIIGVVFDCGGLGDDGQIWGGEFFAGDLKGFKRVGYWQYAPASIRVEDYLRQPWQQAGNFLHQAFGKEFLDLRIDFVRRRESADWTILTGNTDDNFYTSSLARFFDAVALLAGLRETLQYEGQGVRELERIINRSSHVANKIYEFTLKREKGIYLIQPQQIFRGIVEDLQKNTSKSIISAALHNTVIEVVRQLCRKIKGQEKINNVILTGSVFQNTTLFNRLKALLSADGFKLISHCRFACNDSNISFGQAVLAEARC